MPVSNRNLRLFKSGLIESPDMRRAFREIEMTDHELIGEVLAEFKRDLLRFLKGYTNRTRPGDYRAQFTHKMFEGKRAPDRDRVEWSVFAKWWNSPRPAHPGGWADITHELMNSYKIDIETTGSGDFTITVRNESEHAKFVEAMAGFWVVNGIFDPGSKAMRMLEQIFNYFNTGNLAGTGKRIRRNISVTEGQDSTSARVRGESE